MILSGAEIERQRQASRLTIEPFDASQVNPNSYDFRLGPILRVYDDYVLDFAKRNATSTVSIPDDGITLQPGRIYLGHTVEKMGSEHYVPLIKAKSSTARLGLFIHMTADLIDIGSLNQWTLQLNAVQPVRVYPNMLIGQVTFWEIRGRGALYDGKYQGSMGPMESHSYLDFGS